MVSNETAYYDFILAVHVTSFHKGEEFESISKYVIENRFHVTLRTVGPTAVVLNKGYTYPLGVRSNKIFMYTRPENFKDVLSIIVSAVNFIRGQALNHGLFGVFCNEV